MSDNQKIELNSKSQNEKPKTSRQIQAETMRLKLQHIVETLARKKPLDQIKIKEICDQAGVSLGNFYQYFSSKEEAMTYSYNFIDKEWEKLHLEDIKNPLKRLHTLLTTHLTSMANAGRCFLAQLYLSQLKFYDAYFFSSDRYLVTAVRNAVAECQTNGTISKKYTPPEITDKLLSFSRGLTYNFCIKHQHNEKEWLEQAIKESDEYLTLFEKK